MILLTWMIIQKEEKYLKDQTEDNNNITGSDGIRQDSENVEDDVEQGLINIIIST